MTSETPSQYMRSYGCVKCQREHYSDQPIFAEHVGWQSKHGMRTVPDYVVADEREAAHRVASARPHPDDGRSQP